MLISVWFIVVPLAIVCAFLFRRWRERGDGEIGAAILPRLYLLGAYIWTMIANNTLETDRINIIRLGLITMWGIEVIHHLARTSRFRRVVERLTIAANVLYKRIHALYR